MRIIDADALIERLEEIDLYKEDMIGKIGVLESILAVEKLATTQPIIEKFSDGTLHITVDTDIAAVDRILLSQTGTQWGSLYYMDREEEITQCSNCIHNANSPDSGNANCELFYGMSDQFGFCHKAERRTDD